MTNQDLDFEHFNERVAEAFVSMPSHTALPDFLGVTFTEAGPGRLVAEMDVRPELLTPFGNLHGGVIAVLVDHVLGSVMYPVMPRGWWAATTEYKVNNLAPVRDGSLRAEATIIAMTKRTSVVRIDVTNRVGDTPTPPGGERLVCVAQGTCLLQEPKPRDDGEAKTEQPQPAKPERRPGVDVLGLFERGTAWTAVHVAGIKLNQLHAPTPCEEWSVRDVVNHAIGVLNMFAGAAGGGKLVAPPPGKPPDVAGDDPASSYETARQTTIDAYRSSGVLSEPGDGGPGAGRMLGIAFVDQLVHGWDIAKATEQDTAMPADLARAAFAMVNGQIDPGARGPGKIFKEPVEVPDDATDQDKLIAYCGRQP